MKIVWTLVRFGTPLFSRRGRVVLLLSTMSQVALVALDAVALLLLASVFEFTRDTDLSGLKVDTTATKLLTIIVLFVARSALTAIVSWVTVRQLAREESRMGIAVFGVLLNPTTRLEGTVDTHFHNGVDRVPDSLLKVGISISAMISEILTVVVLLGVFVVFDPLTALTSILYFSAVVVAQHRTLAKVSYRQGVETMKLRDGLYRVLSDAAQLRKTLSETSAVSMTVLLSEYRSLLSETRGRSAFVSTVPRYLLELTLAIGILIMGGVAYLASGPTQALTTVVLFTGVSFRLLPVVNRIQVLALSIIGDAPTAKLIFEMPTGTHKVIVEDPRESKNTLEMQGVNFGYSDSGGLVLRDINLCLEKDKQYAIVGPSGSGKTTLVDIFLGLLQPTSGSMRRDKRKVSAYVPQETHIAYISLAENVALAWNRADVDLHRVELALRRAGLQEFLPRINDPTPLLNESLSGGQKQRIGLARAFYSGADFIVLDEVTSALDAETEKDIVEQIYELRGDVTAVIVAHRLSTVRHADHVFYLEDGRLIGSDTFQALADTLPQFRQQIELGQIHLGD